MKNVIALPKSIHVLGFTDKYYTLWYEWWEKKSDARGSRLVQHHSFKKNLSKDKDRAIQIMNEQFGDDWKEDLSVRGQGSFWDSYVKPEKGPADKLYSGEIISECEDKDLLMKARWYEKSRYPERHQNIENRLIQLGHLTEHPYEPGVWVSWEGLEKIEEARECQNWVDRCGHFGKEKERRTFHLKEVKLISYDGFYGRTYIQWFTDLETGDSYLYKGNSPVWIDNADGRPYEQRDTFKCKATIAHTEYDNPKDDNPPAAQTQLKRISLL